MEDEDHEVEASQEPTAMVAEGLPIPPIPNGMPVFADLDSQPLDDLGVSVMDQDVLERNVAAKVWTRMCMN